MDPADAMVNTLESLPDFETELVIASKDWSWHMMMSVLNIPIRECLVFIHSILGFSYVVLVSQ
jgi:hypothetical protein